jgi:hypothetical protein
MTGFTRIPRQWACIKCARPMVFSDLCFLRGRLVAVKVSCEDCRTSEELWVGQKHQHDMRQLELFC